MTVINLQDLGKQIALTAKPIHAAIEKTKQPFNLSAAKIAGKVPELAKLTETQIIRVFKEQDGDCYYSKTLTAYLSDAGEPTIYTADLKPLPKDKVKFIFYCTGINGYVVIEYLGLQLQIDISISYEYRENLLEWGVVAEEGTPPARYLADVPHPTTPLKDLAKGITYQVLKETGIDKKFGSKRYLIKNLKTSEEFEAFENADLRDIIACHSLPCDFMIGDVRERKGNGKGKKFKDSEGYVVRLIDPKKPTFEDIAI